MMTPYVVTRYYRAPEVILGMGYKENGKLQDRSDMFGVLDQWLDLSVFSLSHHKPTSFRL